MESRRTLSPDDLPLVNGRVYHLDLAPEELAADVILVGDPDRVPFLAEELLSAWWADRHHRGFRTMTGSARETGLPLTITTSGIGAPSTEIVLNELAALNEIDFATLTRKDPFTPLSVVRIGTSGGLNPSTPLGALVLTDAVVGLDNTGLFYDVPLPDPASGELERRMKVALDAGASPGARFAGAIVPYVARADRVLLGALEREAVALGAPWARGITISSAGFFVEQGRGVARTAPTVGALVDLLASVDTGCCGNRLENMEMEAGFFLHFLAGLGYRGAAVCAVINRRSDGTFMSEYRHQMRLAGRMAVRAFGRIRDRDVSLPSCGLQL